MPLWLAMMPPMRILITGAAGQLGQSLQYTAPPAIELIVTDMQSLDLRDAANLAAELKKHRPELIINAAGYTAVDKAEIEPELAHEVNGAAVGRLADYCADGRCRLIHVSTDYVFAGDDWLPLKPDDPTDPQSVYGASKLAGEIAAKRAGEHAKVIRSSWIYSEYGENFVRTMLRLGDERAELSIVNDQRGSPTYAHNLAATIWKLANVWPTADVLHYADAGEVTWRQFAEAIFAQAVKQGLLRKAPQVHPISTADYAAPAARPAYSVLDTSLCCELLGVEPPRWQDSLQLMLTNLATARQQAV